MKNRLIIVDISNFIFRAYYAIRPLTSPDGVPVNAVNGVLSMLLKMLSVHKPTHMLIARDVKGDTFRNELYSEYKANRSAPPEDLVPQFDLIEKLVNCLGMKACANEKYEADDVIGSAVTRFKNDFDEILIASGDKDLMQFVGDNVFILDTMKDVVYDRQKVFEKMGVWPEQIVDYLSIVGDSSDNVPGMRGIGAKGAAKLLAEHETLDGCIKAKGTFTGKKLVNAFENHLEDAILSKQLIEIKTDLELGVESGDLEYGFSFSNNLKEFLESLGFKAMLKKLENLEYQDQVASQNDQSGEFSRVNTLVFESEKVTFERAKELLASSKEVAIFADYSDDYRSAASHFSFCVEAKKGYTAELSAEEFSELAQLIWSDANKMILAADVKRDLRFLDHGQIEVAAKFFDISLAHYLVDVSTRHSLEVLCEKYLDHQLKSEGEIFSDKSEHACCIFEIASVLRDELERLKLKHVYYDIDGALVPVLAKMENNGIVLNTNYLADLEKEFSKKIKEISDQIMEHSEEEINLKSPKQVGELLFEKLLLPVVKKTKTGYSTDVEVLEELDSQALSPVPGLILQFREFEKLLSTYVKALPQLVDSKSGRLHSNFKQTVTATGRLSSVNPNLQNIPVKTELGKRIRKAFVASPGKLLLSADYSQVELRLLAHFSKDKTMLNAFNNDEDIHAQTAAEVMDIPLSQVSSSDRSKAKAVNFGLMYGQSSFGLGRALRISRREAKEYITNYFARFSAVKVYLDGLKELCEKHGYAGTMHGRKRFIPEIHSKNRNTKSMAERLAINTPIQGTAADLIKIAMINIQKRLESEKLESKMILQVHDELIFEVPEAELDIMKELVKSEMESVAQLSVTLRVDMGTGVNWFDLK